MQVINLGSWGGGSGAGGGTGGGGLPVLSFLAPTLLGKREFNTSFLKHGGDSSRRVTLPVTIDSQTRLPEREYGQQQDPQQETSEGWP